MSNVEKQADLSIHQNIKSKKFNFYHIKHNMQKPP